MRVNRRLAAGLISMSLALCMSANCGPDRDSEPPGDEVPRPTTPVHVAFAGGGWRAHTGHAAWTMSLLDSGAETLDDVFGNVQTLSSNSGGTWFLSMLAYSQAFRASVELKDAFANYVDQGYLGQERRLLEGSEAVDSEFCSLFDDHPYLHFYCRLASVAGGEGVVWTDIINKVVFEPFGMNDELAATRLGDARQSWADDKSLLMAATLLTDEAVLTENDFLDKLYYNAKLTASGPKQVNVSPVTFSSVSSGKSSPPFLAAAGFDVHYTENADIDPAHASNTFEDPLPNDQVPVLMATAASSAAAGAVASHQVLVDNDFDLAWQIAYVLSDLAVAFELTQPIAHASPEERTVDELAKSKFARLADGGYLDNSGIAQLVRFLQANGASTSFQIVAFDNVQQAFTPTGGGAAVGIDIAYPFGKGLGPGGDRLCVGTSTDQICVTVPDQQIFGADALGGTTAIWSDTPDPTKPGYELIYTRYAVTTVDNETLGVTAGSQGILHAFTCVWPDADTGPFNGASDFDAYAAMLDGIRTALEAEGGQGLKYLRAALAGSGG